MSLLLVLAIGCGFALPAAAADGKPQVSWEQVDNGEVRAALPRNEVTSPEKEPDYQDSDVVRVSIVLEKPSTLEMGYSTMGIAGNRSAMSYRTSLARSQELAVKTISTQALEGQPLDVVWKLTLAANLISANVRYGDMEAIEAVPGVKEVILETRYEPAVYATGEASPNMATSGQMIGTSPPMPPDTTARGCGLRSSTPVRIQITSLLMRQRLTTPWQRMRRSAVRLMICWMRQRLAPCWFS